MDKLEVILKVAERCNINCTYCYVFNGQDDSYKYHSKQIKVDTVESLALFLKDTCSLNAIQIIQIDYHGGEPLLIGKTKFREYCKIFQNHLSDIVEVVFCLQTNAMLIDNDWIDIFEDFNVKVSTSLDGPKHINDIGRIDFKGKGTYEQTLKGLKLLQEAYSKGRIDSVGVICVINPSINASEIYSHFVHELKLDLLEFLLPDETHDSFDFQNKGAYSKYLIDLFENWVNDDNPNIKIRILNSAISLLLGGKSYVVGFGNDTGSAITVSSDGDVSPDDILRSTGTDIMKTGLVVGKNTFNDYQKFYSSSIAKKISNSINKECINCCWYKACGSTHPIHRFSKENGFSNRSVYCEDMKSYFVHISKYLLTKGLPFETLTENLAIEK